MEKTKSKPNVGFLFRPNSHYAGNTGLITPVPNIKTYNPELLPTKWNLYFINPYQFEIQEYLDLNVF